MSNDFSSLYDDKENADFIVSEINHFSAMLVSLSSR